MRDRICCSMAMAGGMPAMDFTSGKAFVLTNDKVLRGRLRKLGISLIYLRSGTHLVVERV